MARGTWGCTVSTLMTSSCDRPPLRRTATRSSKVASALARIGGDLQTSIVSGLTGHRSPSHAMTAIQVAGQPQGSCFSLTTVQSMTSMLLTGGCADLAMTLGKAPAGRPMSFSSNSTRGFRVDSRLRLQSRPGMALATCARILNIRDPLPIAICAAVAAGDVLQPIQADDNFASDVQSDGASRHLAVPRVKELHAYDMQQRGLRSRSSSQSGSSHSAAAERGIYSMLSLPTRSTF